MLPEEALIGAYMARRGIHTEGGFSLGLKLGDLALAVGDAAVFGSFTKFPPPRPYPPWVGINRYIHDGDKKYALKALSVKSLCESLPANLEMKWNEKGWR
jgi:hypothetical protein